MQIATRTLAQFFCALLLGVVQPGSAAKAQALRFTGHDRPLICLNALQPFGFGLSAGETNARTYEVDPFRNGGSDLYVMPDERLQYVRSAGFDCVRMAVDVAALMATSDEITLDRLITQLTAGIARRVNSGLKVIVDIHPFPRGVHPVPGFSDIEIVDGITGPKFKRLIHVVSRLASTMDTSFQPEDVSLELFNEPPIPSAFSKRASWNTQIEFYWRQIRKVLPRHTIIVAGMGFAEIDGTVTGAWSSGIVNLRPAEFDENTGFAFHPYESATFTHQGYPGFFSHVQGLTFPAAAHPGGQKKAEQDFEAAVMADTSLTALEKTNLRKSFIGNRRRSYSFARYWSSFGSQDALAKRLAVVTNWADANGLNRKQIMNTEFGVSRNRGTCTAAASDSSAAEFVRATVENSVAARIGVVTIHEIQGSCFAISADRAPFEFDRTILDALNLP